MRNSNSASTPYYNGTVKTKEARRQWQGQWVQTSTHRPSRYYLEVQTNLHHEASTSYLYLKDRK